ncbi:MAG: hypothetical protein AB3N28_15785 [Kordiimonas sp.]
MAQKTQLFLHIGHPKTASSTLQEFLFKNWRAIKAAGYVMPTAEFGISSEQTPPNNTLWSLQKMREAQDVSALMNWIIKAQTEYPDSKLLLASECLIQPEWPALFQAISQAVDIQLIYYVRRQDQLLLSAWRQWGLKRGLSLDEFLARRLKNKQPDFSETVNAWSTKANVKQHHIRFIQAPFLDGKDLLEDFCAFTNLDLGNLERVNDQNVSVDARLALFLSNHSELFSSVHDEDIFDLLRSPDGEEPAVRLHFNEDQFNLIHAVFEPLNQSLLKTYQPDCFGKAVISHNSARLADMNAAASPADQLTYVAERTYACEKPTHPKIEQLKRILQEQYGVTDV